MTEKKFRKFASNLDGSNTSSCKRVCKIYFGRGRKYMNTFISALIIILIYLCIYGVVSRICRCFEYCADCKKKSKGN